MSDRVGFCVTHVVKISVHAQVPVSANHDMVVFSVVQNREDTVLEEVWVISLGRCIYSNYQQFFTVDFNQGPHYSATFVLAFPLTGEG